MLLSFFLLVSLTAAAGSVDWIACGYGIAYSNSTTGSDFTKVFLVFFVFFSFSFLLYFWCSYSCFISPKVKNTNFCSLSSVIQASDRFVAVGVLTLTAGCFPIYYSFDGVNWVGLKRNGTGLTANIGFKAVGSDGDKIIALSWTSFNDAEGAIVQTTVDDLANWKPLVNASSFFSQYGEGTAIKYAEQIKTWVAVGATFGPRIHEIPKNTLMYSRDGAATWTGIGHVRK